MSVDYKEKNNKAHAMFLRKYVLYFGLICFLNDFKPPLQMIKCFQISSGVTIT